MKNTIFIYFTIIASICYSQYEPLNLKSCLIVGQLDDQDDRFTLEVNLAEIFALNGVKTMASLNLLKRGGDLRPIASDSVIKVLKSKGIDTYALVSVRGYDNNFKLNNKPEGIYAELDAGHLFPLYREGISSLTLEFNFYRDGKFIGNDLVKLSSIGDRDEVIKKMRKKIPKRIRKYWM